ncbi:MAG: hypothetical protein ACRDJO_07115 [Actinomycetota bacterium]
MRPAPRNSGDRLGARLRDAFLDATLRSGSDLAGRSTVRAELLTRAETILAEPDEGVTSPLADLWSAFEDLPANPANGRRDEPAARPGEAPPVTPPALPRSDPLTGATPALLGLPNTRS